MLFSSGYTGNSSGFLAAALVEVASLTVGMHAEPPWFQSESAADAKGNAGGAVGLAAVPRSGRCATTVQTSPGYPCPAQSCPHLVDHEHPNLVQVVGGCDVFPAFQGRSFSVLF